MGFLVICFGIVILQMSKIDPASLNKLDRRSTLLLQASRAKTEGLEEKGMLGAEEPGMDALRGSFGTIGSIIRARSARRMSQASSSYRLRHVGASGSNIMSSPLSRASSHLPQPADDPLGGMKRHQLYDAPMPPRAGQANVEVNSTSSVLGSPSGAKRQTIKFGSEDVVHQYDRPGTGDRVTEHRRAVASPLTEGYPPLPNPPASRTEGLPGSTGGLFSQRSTESLSPVEEIGSASSSATGSGQHGRDDTLHFLGTSEASGHTLVPEGRHTGETKDVQGVAGAGSIALFGSSKSKARPDSRAVFDMHLPSPAPSAGTLLTFPSVTDSARSDDLQWETDDESERLRKGRTGAQRTTKTGGNSVHGSPRGSERGRSSKRYPRGSGEDDREESMSLWRRSGTDEDTSDEQASPLSPELTSGIRLVTSSPNTTF